MRGEMNIETHEMAYPIDATDRPDGQIWLYIFIQIICVASQKGRSRTSKKIFVEFLLLCVKLTDRWLFLSNIFFQFLLHEAIYGYL